MLLLLCCFTSTDTVWLSSDGGRMGLKREYEPRPSSLFTHHLSSLVCLRFFFLRLMCFYINAKPQAKFRRAPTLHLTHNIVQVDCLHFLNQLTRDSVTVRFSVPANPLCAPSPPPPHPTPHNLSLPTQH